MHITEFLEKYYMDSDSQEFKSDWEIIKKKCSSDDELMNVLMEQLVEKEFSFNLIKDLFEANPHNVEILNNPNLFKWAAGLHSEELIKFFHEKLSLKDEQGAINAAIINARLDNLKALNKLHINVFNEKHFSQAIQRSHQTHHTNIVDYFVKNLDKFKITNYSKKLLADNPELITWAINDGNTNLIDYLIKNTEKIELGKWFINACESKQLTVVKHLLDNYHFNQDFKLSSMIDSELIAGYETACIYNYSKISKYLLTHPKLKEKITPRTKDSVVLRYTCGSNNDNYVHFLLTSPELSEHADIHANHDESITFACSSGNLDIAKYLLTSSELKEHANFRANNYQNFVVALESENDQLVEYLVLNNHVEYSEDIKTYLEKEKLHRIINLFKIREFNQNLHDTLPQKSGANILKPKI